MFLIICLTELIISLNSWDSIIFGPYASSFLWYGHHSKTWYHHHSPFKAVFRIYRLKSEYPPIWLKTWYRYIGSSLYKPYIPPTFILNVLSCETFHYLWLRVYTAVRLGWHGDCLNYDTLLWYSETTPTFCDTGIMLQGKEDGP